jgi:uncharacterized membrane protein
MNLIRWILFVPLGFAIGVIASGILRICVYMLPEIFRLLLCGVGGAAGIVIGGLFVAPKKNAAAKWTLVVVSFVVACLNTLGGLLPGDWDKLVSRQLSSDG